MIAEITVKSKFILKITTVLLCLSMSATLFAMDYSRDTRLTLGKIPANEIEKKEYKFTCKKHQKLNKDRIDKIFREIAEMSKSTEKITGMEIEICRISYKKAKYLAGKASEFELSNLVVPHNDKYHLIHNPSCREIPVKRPWRAQKIETKNKKATSTKNHNYMQNRFDQYIDPMPSQYGNGYNNYYTGKSNLVGVTGGF